MSNIPMLGPKPSGNSTPGNSILGSRAGQSVFPNGSASAGGAENRGDREWFSSVWKSLQKDSQQNNSSSDEGKNVVKEIIGGGSGNDTEKVPVKTFPGQGAMMPLDGKPISDDFYALHDGHRMMKNESVEVKEDEIEVAAEDVAEDGAGAEGVAEVGAEVVAEDGAGAEGEAKAKAKDGVGLGKDDMTSDTAQENFAIREKATALFERIRAYSESLKTGTDGVEEDADSEFDSESDPELLSDTPGMSAAIASGIMGDVAADEETEDGEEDHSADQKLKGAAKKYFPGQPVSTDGKKSVVDGKSDKEPVENRPATIGIGSNVKAGAESGEEIKTSGEAENKKAAESDKNKPVAENTSRQNLPASGIGAAANGGKAGHVTAADRNDDIVREKVNGPGQGFRTSQFVGQGNAVEYGTTAKVDEKDRQNGDLPRIPVAEEEGLKTKAGETRQNEGAHQSLRYASMTREFAQRLEQIVKGGAGNSELQNNDGKGESKPEISPGTDLGGKNPEIQSEDVSSRLQAARYENHIKAFSERSASAELIRIPVIAGSDTGAVNQMQTLSAVKPVSGDYFAGSASVEEDEFEWKKYVVMQSATGENGEEENNDEFTSISRLNHQPISNGDLRRDVMPALARFIQSAQESDRSKQSNWQNHRFVMDDGKNIKISVREVEGVMQLKLGTSSQELARLLQQHHQEIRDHLEKECNIEIDFQLDSKNMDEFSEFFGESSPQNGSQRDEALMRERTEPLRVEKVVPQSVRSFGYNQMEWTA